MDWQAGNGTPCLYALQRPDEWIIVDGLGRWCTALPASGGFQLDRLGLLGDPRTTEP